MDSRPWLPTSRLAHIRPPYRPSLIGTRLLASISAASTAACAASKRCLSASYSGPLSQWAASPFRAASSPARPERSRAISLVTPFGSCGPISEVTIIRSWFPQTPSSYRGPIGPCSLRARRILSLPVLGPRIPASGYRLWIGDSPGTPADRALHQLERQWHELRRHVPGASQMYLIYAVAKYERNGRIVDTFLQCGRPRPHWRKVSSSSSPVESRSTNRYAAHPAMANLS